VNGTTLNFRDAALQRDAELYWHLQSTALLKQFAEAHGRAASTIQELEDWVAATAPRPKIDPYSILTREKIDAAIVEALKSRAAKIRRRRR